MVDMEVQDLRQADTWNRMGDAIASMKELYEEYSVDNWDGYMGEAVTAGAYEEALNILNALPPHLPIPEFVAEPDGSIGLEWSNGPDRIFAASVSGKGLIVYAGILGRGNKAHGTEVFDDSLPESISGKIKRIYC
jgi:hypothetical protein